MQSLNLFRWCCFDADESWHIIHLFANSEANINQASFFVIDLFFWQWMCIFHISEDAPRTSILALQTSPTSVPCFYNCTAPALFWSYRNDEQPLNYLLLFSLSTACLSFSTTPFTITLSPYFPGPQGQPSSLRGQGPRRGASQHCFEVERLKRKDLSNWDDVGAAGRGGRSLWGTGEAVNTESWEPMGHN